MRVAARSVTVRCGWLLAGLSLAVAGCATGDYLAAIGSGELPLDEAPRPLPAYPTAIRSGEAPRPALTEPTLPRAALQSPVATVEPAPKPAAPAIEPTNEASPAETAHKPPQTPAPLIAPLAVFPPALRTETVAARLESPAVVGAIAPAAATVAAPAAMAPEPSPVATPGAAPVAPTPVATLGAAPQVAAASQPIPAEVTPTLVATNSQPQPAAPAIGVAAVSSPEERLDAIAQQRDVLIAMLEDEIRTRRQAAPGDAELSRMEQHLRLLYASAGREDDAASGVESLPPAEREAYKHLVFGLSTWLSEDESRRAPLRNARVLRSLRDATGELAAASKLDLKNLAFCEKVDYFGGYTEFSRAEFSPRQQVILYVEVDNFAAQEKSAHAFETELQGSYQIFDASGNVVGQRTLPLDREVCRNYRRDYFLAYRVFMPDDIGPGKYRLELTIEDLKAKGEFKGRKLGEGMIEFSVRN
jgi:hypothetical protein